ncbi:MAG: tRNA nucleotidyltransferase, partial [Saprospiraceae bacterium]|nr:tRNA nucleotidyltransferase [Saprospiraceae bacterium]
PDNAYLINDCESDSTPKNPTNRARYLEGYRYLQERMAEVSEADRMRLWQPPITGEIIMATFGIPPSREVGIIKTAIREAILDGQIDNDYAAGFQRMLEEGGKLGLVVVG